jgi:hypothetical protein
MAGGGKSALLDGQLLSRFEIQLYSGAHGIEVSGSPDTADVRVWLMQLQRKLR